MNRLPNNEALDFAKKLPVITRQNLHVVKSVINKLPLDKGLELLNDGITFQDKTLQDYEVIKVVIGKLPKDEASANDTRIPLTIRKHPYFSERMQGKRILNLS